MITTKDIKDIFNIQDTLPNRELRTDNEVLDYVKACLMLERNFNKIFNEDEEEDDI